MAVTESLIRGAYNANAPAAVSPAQAWIDASKNIAEMASKYLIAQTTKKKENKAKGDTYLTAQANKFGNNIQGPLQDQYGVVSDDLVFQRDIWVNAEDDPAYQTTLSMHQEQGAADTAGLSATIKNWADIQKGNWEGAPLSNSVSAEEFSYIANPVLSQKMTFQVGEETKTVTRGVPDDDAWLTENLELIQNGTIKQTGSRYGLLKTTGEGENITTTWVSTDEVKAHLDQSLVNIKTRGVIVDLGEDMRVLGENYAAADPGKVEDDTYAARRDKRREFNDTQVRQRIEGMITDDLKHWEMRSIINDPMIGGDIAMIDHMKVLFDTTDIEEELKALEVDVLDEFGEPTGTKMLAADADNNGEVTKKEMLDFISNYDDEAMTGEAKKVVDGMVKDYLFMYAKNQFVVAAGGEYETGLEPGQTTGGTKYEDPFEDILDWDYVD